MLRRDLLVLFAVAGASCLTAAPAIASTKCFCSNGVIVQSMTDDGDDDDCDDACSEFGGGRLWTPADSQSDGGGSDTYIGNPNEAGGVRPGPARGVERLR